MVGILLSYWGGLFSGAMLVSGRVFGLKVMFLYGLGFHGMIFITIWENIFGTFSRHRGQAKSKFTIVYHYTLPETHMSPLKHGGWKGPFPFLMAYFHWICLSSRGYIRKLGHFRSEKKKRIANPNGLGAMFVSHGNGTHFWGGSSLRLKCHG